MAAPLPASDPIEKHDSNERYMDPEDGFLKPENPQVDDPFGNEANAEVKYKTLKWWYAPCPADAVNI